MSSSDPRGLSGKVVAGRYRVQECLGTGTMGSVYRAEHIHMKKTVAIKILHPSHVKDPEVVERFQREAQAAANIDHPNICAATDFGKLDDDFYYLVMEYLDGRALVDELDPDQAMDPERVLHIAIQMCAGLERAHEVGVVHRDLKPENVLLVERDEDQDFVKITDFGVAKVRMFKDAARLTQAGVVYGSPLYMSPEQAAGKDVDHRADLYSVGIMLYELLTGHLPFYTKNLTILLNMHIAESPPPFAEIAPDVEVDPEVEAIIMCLLAKDREERFQSAAELGEALTEVQERLYGTRGSGEAGLAQIVDRIADVLPADGISRRIVVIGGTAVAALAILVAAVFIGSMVEDSNAESSAEGFEFSRDTVASAGVAAARETFVEQSGIGNVVAEMEKSPEVAVRRLRQVHTKHPGNPHASFLLGKALIRAGNWDDGLKAYDEALRREPLYARDPELLDDVMIRLEDPHRRDAAPAAKLVKEHLDGAANRRLAELAEHHKVRRIRKRALKLLEDTGEFASLPPWNQLTIRLRHAVGCAENREWILAIGKLGDSRALAALRRFSALPKTGCGEDEREDCYACLRDDLRKAISKLQTSQRAPVMVPARPQSNDAE